jgi:hypothetical protein
MSLANNMAAFARSPSGNNPNLIINGGMTVSQRGTVTGITSTEYTAADRWKFFVETTDAIVTTTVEASPTLMADAGFPNALKVDCTTVEASLAGSDFCSLEYRFEGQDVQHLLHGSSGSQQVTVSFWWQSPKSGTQVVYMTDQDNNYGCPMEFTVASADTAEFFEITFPVHTNGSGLDNDNAFSLSLGFPLMTQGYENTANVWTSGGGWRSTSNQQNLLDNTANNIYLTGVKLEVGSSATAFEHESYGDTLAKCLRYFERWSYDTVASEYLGISGNCQSTTAWNGAFMFHEKRTTPTFVTGNANAYDIVSGASGFTASAVSIGENGRFSARFGTTISGATTGNAGIVRRNGSNTCFIEIDAEL